MKRFIFFILFTFLFVPSVFAFDSADILLAWNLCITGSSSVSSACTSCTPGDPADIFCEDFEGSNNPVNSSSWCTPWVVTVDGSNVVTTGSHTNTWQSCTADDLGVKSLHISILTGQGEDAQAKYDPNFAAGAVYGQFYFFWDNDNTDPLAAAEQFPIVTLNGADSLLLAEFQVYNLEGTIILYFNYRTDGGYGSKIAITPLNENQVYQVEFQYVKNILNGANCWIDGVEKAPAEHTTANVDIDHIVLGAIEGGRTDLWSAGASYVEIDMIELDATALPTDCEE